MDVSVVLPTYNERESICVLIPKIVDVFKRDGHTFEIIIVDDSSPDGTAEVLRKLKLKLGADIRVITRARKEGVGSALREGYDNARYDNIVSLDSDLSCNPEDILTILEKLDEGYDLVVGSRYHSRGYYERKYLKTFLKNVVSRWGNIFVRVITGVKLTDFSLNFRGIRRDVWEKLKTEDKTNSMLLEMIVKANYSGYRLGEVPVTFKDRIYGESKINLPAESLKFLTKSVWFTVKYRLIGCSKKMNSKREIFLLSVLF